MGGRKILNDLEGIGVIGSDAVIHAVRGIETVHVKIKHGVVVRAAQGKDVLPIDIDVECEQRYSEAGPNPDPRSSAGR